MSKLSPRLALIAVLVVALAVRGVAALATGFNPIVFDSQIYLRMAQGMLSESPQSSFPNGYPFFLALILAVVPGALKLKAMLAANVLFSTATVFLGYGIARRVARSEWVGVAVAAGLALWPHQIHYTRLVMSESLCTFWLTLGLWLLVEALQPGREDDSEQAGWWLGGGFALSMATVARPSVMLVGPLLLVAYVVLRRKIKPAAFAVGGYLVGTLLFVGMGFLGIVKPPITGPNNALLSIRYTSNDMRFIEFPPEERAQATKTYLTYAAQKPGAFLKQRAISLWELWGFWSLPGYRAEAEGAVTRAIVLLRFPLLLLAVVGFLPRRRDPLAWCAFAPLLGLTLVHIASFSNHRFIVPVEPALFALAALPLAGLLARRRKQDAPHE